MVPLTKLKKISLIHNKLMYLKVEAPSSISTKASMTIEAALVFPFSLFCLLGMLYFFPALKLTRITEQSLYQTACYGAIKAGVRNTSQIERKLYFQKELSQNSCPFSFLQGGKLAINWVENTIDADYIEVQISYKCKLPIQILGISCIPITQGVRIKKWTGFQGETVQVTYEDWVYVTKNGKVYHQNRDCTHLKLAIKTVLQKDAQERGYQPCKLCGGIQGIFSYCYVTEEGTAFHRSLGCSGLKRTVYMVKKTEIGDKMPCQRCGGIE